jgi:anaerobic selenocysteine-containing dehydrogenase
MWIERGNPVTSNPETHLTLQAMRKLDFRVVIDEFLTDTAREADIVLPSKTFFEQSDLITAYWHSYLQYRQKVLDPPGEVWPETDIYWQLGRRMGYSIQSLEKAGLPQPGESEALLREALEGVNQEHGSALSLERLAKGPMLAPGTQEIAFSDLVFSTPSGKIELVSKEAALRWGVDPLPRWTPPLESALRPTSGRYPLQMLTPNIKNSIHSQFNNLAVIRQYDPGPQLSMHPEDARRRGLADGSRVRIFNDRGELFLPLRLDSGIRPGCVSCPNGYWIQNGGGVNFLSEGRETDMGHGAAFHDNLVEVEAAGGER